MTDEHKTMQEKLLTSIKEGELKMRSRSYFILKSILVLIGSIALATLLLYFGSFAFYAVSLPWIPIFAAILVALLLERVLNNYAPAYRWPIAYTFGLLVFLALLVSFSLHRAHLHERIHRFVRTRQVPVFEPFYRRLGPSLDPRLFR